MILNTRIDSSEVTDYVSEMSKRASDVFRICKLYSENQMISRNADKNVGRKFKNIKVGDRIYLKTNIRRHKFIPRFQGPFRVVGVKGSTVFCYSLLSKKHKTVDMDKCRLLSELSEEDAKVSAFPEDESVDQEVEEDGISLDIVPNQADSNVPSVVIDTSQVKRGGGSKKPDMPSAVPVENKVNKKHRYFLRSKL